MTALALVAHDDLPIDAAFGPPPLRVALAGCGTVGGGLLGLLATHGQALERRLGRRVEIVSVLVRDPLRERPHLPARGVLTTSVDEFLAAQADVVVEAIGGIEPAHRIVRDSLLARRPVITANKSLLAALGPELLGLAEECGTRLEFEAAVGGVVPVVRTLRAQLAGHGITRVRGVINGTTNFVLDQLSRGASWEASIAEAQRLGFAEADPSRDLDGRDAEDKLRVLAWLAFGIEPQRVHVQRTGISAELATAARGASATGEVVRLVAELREEGGLLTGRIRPELLSANDALAQVRNEENAIEIHSSSAGVVRLSGRGAGGSATASAVLADLLAAAPGLIRRSVLSS